MTKEEIQRFIQENKIRCDCAPVMIKTALGGRYLAIIDTENTERKEFELLFIIHGDGSKSTSIQLANVESINFIPPKILLQFFTFITWTNQKMMEI